ncbi:hypothetical protein SETIT_3G057600v2 [Setaria italica]|uniref:FAM86 N-terminal domain-containing protein n=1 Tax=Setaria italica TaxID=4555 RepID=A0A368QC95_SETIT|nr:putative uncharacterized protein DDB_G0277003 isoform X1 [Setaria italica]RCV15454.1 hypothetical protein SETIT_3G057600v2 [Setaria italica]
MAGAAAQDDAEQLLHLKLAFLAGEPPACILALARKAGGGSITPHVQKFLLENCTDTNVYGRQNSTYTTTIFKRIISEVELSSDIVIDALYEEFAQRMLSKAKDSLLNKTNHIYKEISFLSSTHDNVSSSLISVVARLSCSSNMLEGDTGCSLWPSSLFLSEFILSYPEIFSTKCCFELGSGVGLVGICLNYVGASKVILTDGDTSTLTNMKENMELNNVCIKLEDFEELKESKNKVECKYLSWEEASESDLRGYQPDIVLGADIVYDPVCVPHLVRVLSMLLRRDSKQGEVNRKSGDELEMDGPVAYIATVVRNAETFNCFAKAAADAKLSAINIGSSTAPSNFLPYMLSYDRSSVQLLKITLSS